MGQYWLPVNLDKREFVHPHKLGAGLKLWEQLANHPGTAAALIVLCAAQPEKRGGGDLSDKGRQIIGRWAGDRIALIGDYAEPGDLPAKDHAELIYSLCDDPAGILSTIDHWSKVAWTGDPATKKEYRRRARLLSSLTPYTDITDQVAAVLERELGGRFSGTGWRNWTTGQGEENPIRGLKPDLVVVAGKG